MNHIIIGTAGHIDHGKSLLVKNLTGTDPDRLKEEKEREMTIDIGFAFLGEKIAIIDVPGHERFVKNMITGVNTIDYFMLVVAADDGIMPQTIEHVNILKLLGLKKGCAVITKIDTVPEDRVLEVERAVGSLLEREFGQGMKVFRVDNVSGRGVDVLKRHLLKLPGDISPIRVDDVARMPIDRAFTLPGVGVVVTGSVVSGFLRKGTLYEILPNRKRVKVRNIQVMGRNVGEAGPGQRAALNLSGIKKEEVGRGCVIASPGVFSSGYRLTVYVRMVTGMGYLGYNSLCRVHIGTGELIGRIRFIGNEKLKAGEEAFAQIEFEKEVSCGFKDRFVLRRYSPMVTIGGGIILEIGARRLKRKNVEEIAFLRKLLSESIHECIKAFVERYGKQGVTSWFLVGKITRSKEWIEKILAEMAESGDLIKLKDFYIVSDKVEDYKNEVLEFLRSYFKKNPLTHGVSISYLNKKLKGYDCDLLGAICEELSDEGEVIVDKGKIGLRREVFPLDEDARKIVERVWNHLRKQGLRGRTISSIAEELEISRKIARDAVGLLVRDGRVLIAGEYIYSMDEVEKAKRKIEVLLSGGKQATVSEIKNFIGGTRRYVIPLLEYFDKIKFTKKLGNYRVLGSDD